MFCGVAFYLVSYPSLQMIALLILQLLIQIYQGRVCPKELKVLNKLELFNESLIYVSMLHLMLFFPEYVEIEFGYTGGFFMIAVISIVIGVNLYLVFYHGLRAVCLLFIRYKNLIWHKCCRKKRKNGLELLREMAEESIRERDMIRPPRGPKNFDPNEEFDFSELYYKKYPNERPVNITVTDIQAEN